MKKKVLKPFDLEKAKAGAEVCTRDERKVRILCYDLQGKYPIVAILKNSNNEEESYQFTVEGFAVEGKCYLYADKSVLDLFIVEYEGEQPQFKPFDKVLVRDNNTEKWCCDLFSYMSNGSYPFCCVSNAYAQCIPYERNEHLVGTTNKPE